MTCRDRIVDSIAIPAFAAVVLVILFANHFLSRRDQ